MVSTPTHCEAKEKPKKNQYPLGMTNITNWKMAIEIMDLSTQTAGSVQFVTLTYQRVAVPRHSGHIFLLATRVQCTMLSTSEARRLIETRQRLGLQDKMLLKQVTYCQVPLGYGFLENDHV